MFDAAAFGLLEAELCELVPVATGVLVLVAVSVFITPDMPVLEDELDVVAVKLTFRPAPAVVVKFFVKYNDASVTFGKAAEVTVVYSAVGRGVD